MQLITGKIMTGIRLSVCHQKCIEETDGFWWIVLGLLSSMYFYGTKSIVKLLDGAYCPVIYTSACSTKTRTFQFPLVQAHFGPCWTFSVAHSNRVRTRLRCSHTYSAPSVKNKTKKLSTQPVKVCSSESWPTRFKKSWNRHSDEWWKRYKVSWRLAERSKINTGSL